jgi:threonine aldolase
MKRKSFASDNYAGIHPKILQALLEANQEDAPAYGADTWTAEAVEMFREQFGSDTEIFFVLTGTAANVLGLQAALASHQAILCPKSAHLNVDECGAPEKYIGSKLLTISTGNGKLSVDLIRPYTTEIGDQHKVQPKVISIAQATELGTVYTEKEIKKLADFAHTNGWYLHMDGARLCNAAAYLNVPLKALTKDVGVDILSFGGTKNGMMLGEAVLFFDKKLAEDFKYIRKQGMQLCSKMRFISAQFIALLSNNLWLKNARHANSMAQLLAEQLRNIKEIDVANAIESNAVFARLDPKYIVELQKKYQFYVWDEINSEVRWMTSFNTTEADVLQFVDYIKKTIKKLS